MTQTQTSAPELERLYGTDSHFHLLHAVEGLDAETAGRKVDGFSFSIHQLLRHMVYWQDVALARIEGRKPTTSDDADGWNTPVQPTEAEWAGAVEGLTAGVRQLATHLDELPGNETTLRNVRMVEGHNSYHLGQIVTLRRMFGAWPPPRGGGSW